MGTFTLHRNPATLAGAKYLQNNEDVFVPPYWINQYTALDMLTHVGVLVCLPAGAASHSTSNITLSLEKENTELVIDMQIDKFYTDLCMLKLNNLLKKVGVQKAVQLNIALELKMSYV